MNGFNRFCYLIQGILFLNTLFVFVMELPKTDKIIPIKQYQLPELKVLAARKVIELLDSDHKKKIYKKICDRPKEILSYLAHECAHKNAAVLQTILDEEIEPFELRMIYYPPFTNLYEVSGGIKRGIRSREGLFIPSLSEENKDALYYRVCMSQDKSFCVTRWPYANCGLALAVWDVKTGEKLKIITYEGDKLQMHSKHEYFHISPDNKTIFARNRYNSLMCGFSVENGQKLYEYKGKHLAHIGQSYFCLPENKSLVVRRISDNTQVSRLPIFLFRGSDGFYSHTYSMNKNEHYGAVVSSKNHKQIKVFDIKNGLELFSLSFLSGVWDMKFNNDGSVLVLFFVNKTVFWNVKQNKKMGLISSRCNSVSSIFYDDDRIFFINFFAGNSWWNLNTYQPVIERKCSEKMPYEIRMKFAIDEVTEDGKLGIGRMFPHLIYSLYLQLAKELSFKELAALLILEHENLNNKPFSQDAWNVLEATDNKVLKTIFEKRYESIPSEMELELAAQEIAPTWDWNKCASKLNGGILI